MVTRRQKEETVAELEESFKKAQSLILADYKGLSVAEINRLRRMARESGVQFRVVKNTLALMASQRAGIEGLDEIFTGPTAIALSYEDPIQPAKVLRRFGTETRREVPFKGGFLEGRVLSPDEVKDLAALPGRPELLAKLAGSLQGPLAGLHAVLAGNLQGLVVALGRIAEQKEKASAA